MKITVQAHKVLFASEDFDLVTVSHCFFASNAPSYYFNKFVHWSKVGGYAGQIAAS